MAMTNPFQALRLIWWHTRSGQEFQSALLIERIQLDRLEQAAPARGRQPRDNRPLTPAKDEAHVVRQQRNEYLPEPRVHQSKRLVGVQRDNDSLPNVAKAHGHVLR